MMPPSARVCAVDQVVIVGNQKLDRLCTIRLVVNLADVLGDMVNCPEADRASGLDCVPRAGNTG